MWYLYFTPTSSGSQYFFVSEQIRILKFLRNRIKTIQVIYKTLKNSDKATKEHSKYRPTQKIFYVKIGIGFHF